MLNYIWAFMIIIGVVYGIVTNRVENISNGIIESTKDAVTMCITMLGIMSMWMGFMEVAKKSGLISKCEKTLKPFIRWIFPNIPEDHPSMQYITTNIIANLLGLGWAATPAGLKAMEKLAENPIKQAGYKITPKHIATDEMCAFLVLNISSLQLIPVNIIAFRSQYGAPNPAAIVLPAIIATTASTGVGILWCKIKYKKK